MKKRYYVLLEVLISIAIISICIVPLIRNPIYFYKKELKQLEKLEHLRIKQQAIYKIRKKLFLNKIPWKSFSSTGSKKAFYSYFSVKNNTYGKIFKKNLKVYYRIWTKLEKEDKSVIYRKIVLEFSIDKPFKYNKKYSEHYLFAKKSLL